MRRLILTAIIILGFTIRIYQITTFPVSLNWDEASHGYNAYSILKTGKDEWGISYPSIFRAFGDYKLPVYIYSIIPFIQIFGLNTFSVRILSVVAGTLSIIGTYYLTKIIFIKSKSKDNISLMAAFFVAFTPWNIFLSRVAVEANLASTLIIWGVYFFLAGINKIQKNIKSYQLHLSSLLLGISMFTYNSARVFSPLIYAVLVMIYWKYWGYKITIPFHIPYISSRLSKINKTVKTPICYCHLSAFALMLFFVLLTVYQTLYTHGSTARLTNISLLDQGAINTINESRGNSNYPVLISRLLHNKVTYVAQTSASAYLSYSNPFFWFGDGGKHYQFSLPNFPLLLWISAPGVIIGIFSLIKKKGKPLLILTVWLALAPIPASITRDNPHALRILLLTPIPHILSAVGFMYIYIQTGKNKINYLFLGLLILISILQINIFWRSYTTTYANNYAWAWQSGSKDLVEYIKLNYQDYDQIYITKKYGEPHIFFAFYWPWDASDFQQNKQWEYRDAGTKYAWYWVNKIDKISFVNDWEMHKIICTPGSKCIRVDISDIIQPGWENIDTIKDFAGKDIYIISKSSNE